MMHHCRVARVCATTLFVIVSWENAPLPLLLVGSAVALEAGGRSSAASVACSGCVCTWFAVSDLWVVDGARFTQTRVCAITMGCLLGLVRGWSWVSKTDRSDFVAQ
jgi:hypothetical protein